MTDINADSVLAAFQKLHERWTERVRDLRKTADERPDQRRHANRTADIWEAAANELEGAFVLRDRAAELARAVGSPVPGERERSVQVNERSESLNEGTAKIYLSGRLVAESLAGVSFVYLHAMANVVRVSIKNAVPLEGFDADFRSAVTKGKMFSIEVQLVDPGRARARLCTSGWFEEVVWDVQSDAATMTTARFDGGQFRRRGEEP